MAYAVQKFCGWESQPSMLRTIPESCVFASCRLLSGVKVALVPILDYRPPENEENDRAMERGDWIFAGLAVFGTFIFIVLLVAAANRG